MYQFVKEDFLMPRIKLAEFIKKFFVGCGIWEGLVAPEMRIYEDLN